MLCRVLCIVLFVGWTGEWPLEFDQQLYFGYWRSPFQVFGPLFVSIPGINLFAWQIILFALTPLCLLWPGAFRKRAWSMDAAILMSFLSVVVTFMWGVMRGGSAYNAYYQLWRFLTALLVAVLVGSVIRTSRDLKAIGTTVLAAALVRATLCIYFYWVHVNGKINPPPIHMTTHDDSLLFVAGLLVMLSWGLARARWKTWLVIAVLSAEVLYAIVLNNRRLAWIEIALVLAVVYLLLPRGGRRRVHKFLLFAGPVVLLYVVVGWGRQGALFAPIRALSTSGSNEDNSSLARLEEMRNLMYTLSATGNPLFGTGWGVPYQKVTSVYANFGPGWWQYLYMPHNSLLGVAVFGGLVGIFGMWGVVPVAALLASRGYRASAGAVDRAAAMAAVGILPAYGSQCYGDIGFQSLTCALILGVALSVAGKVSAMSQAPPVRLKEGRRGLQGPSPPVAPAHQP
jgi:hypothetical protein